MKIFSFGMLKQKLDANSNNYFPWIMVGCSVLLMLIWPVKHTIALRILLLFAGGIIGFAYIIRERSSLHQKSALPLLFLFLFSVWLVIQYFFFSHNQQLELQEITGTWMRVLFACVLGIGTGLFVRNHRPAQLAILIGILSFFIFVYFDYVWVSVANNNWSIPYRFDLGFFGYKNPAVFYGITSLALACGVISFQLTQAPRMYGPLLFASLVSIGLTFLTFVITGTKNGVAIGVFLTLSVFVSFLSRSRKSIASISIAAIFFTFICSVSYLHVKLNPEWTSVFPSVEAGMQIDKYPNWKNHQDYGLPKLADGTLIGESAYLRTAYVIAGLRLLRDNLFGYGVYDKSFRYLADEELSLPPQSSIIGTHCGWLDFALGLGIPGLLLIWSAIALAFIYSFKEKSLWSFITRWILAGIFIAWMLDELCNNHYIETLFYLIALLSAGNLPINTKNARSVSETVPEIKC
jgi:hypothetical protein